MDADAVASAGDRVRYALEYTAAGRTRHWTLELSLPEDPRLEPLYTGNGADPVSGFVRTHGALWGSLQDKRSRKSLLRYSTNAEVQVRLVREDSGEQFIKRVPTQVQAHVWQPSVDTLPQFGLEFLFRMLLELEPVLDDLVSVVQSPSVGSVLANGMNVWVEMRFDDEAPLEVSTVDTPLGPLPAFWLPARLFANDQPALDCRLLLTWRRSPLLLSLGVLRIEGHHPTDPGRTVTAQLVGAERGAAARTGDPSDLGVPGVRVGMTEPELVAVLRGTVNARYRVPMPDGTAVDLVTFVTPDREGIDAAAFVAGRLQFLHHGGIVSSYLEHRGAKPGVYAPENRVQ